MEPQNTTSSFSVPDSEDAIIAQFLLDLEQQGPAALGEYSCRYPQLADTFRSFLVDQEKLERQLHESPDEFAMVPKQLGEFRILRRIGAGGMGEVFLAEQDRLHRRVVVKILRRVPDFSASRERFAREQEVLARLEQANIVPIITTGEDEHSGAPYFVMRHIEGASLDIVIRVARKWQSRPGIPAPTISTLANYASTTDGSTGNVSTATRDGDSASRDCPVLQPQQDFAPLVPTNDVSESVPATLSFEYYRSVAQVMVDVTEAVQHAHAVGILHRDLKPSNLVLDRSGRCWVIDFGLAGLMVTPEQTSTLPGGYRERTLALTQGALGTPQYMAPEQYAGQTDARSDVWGLGATLYELLTLEPAFRGNSRAEIQQRVCIEEPMASSRSQRGIPRTLIAICLKALQKDADRRYQTAGQFAADLRNWLDHRVTMARPATVIHRMALWARRNTGWATAIGLSLLTFCAVTVGLIQLEHAKAVAAEDRAKIIAAEEKNKTAAAQRQTELLTLARDRLTRHVEGWSDRLISGLTEIQGQQGNDGLRDAAIAMLNGVDARCVTRLPDVSSTSVAIDGQGRLLVGGSPRSQQFSPILTASIRTPQGDVIGFSEQAGPGPVAFTPEGIPLHVTSDPADRSILRLWDVANQRLVREFKIPAHGDASSPRVPMTLALTPSGSLVAASTAFQNGDSPDANVVEVPESTTLLVWETQTGRLVRQENVDATAIAFTPDDDWLATGDRNGVIRMFPLPQGEPVMWTTGRLAVKSLAIGRDIRRRMPNRSEWLLAVGDVAGGISTWDSNAQRLASCRGAVHEVFALTFSPDNMTLVSAGRGGANMWDLTTGNLLVHLHANDFANGLAFSSDGRRLAITSEDGFGRSALTVYELEQNRGVHTLRGPKAPIMKVVFSPDGRWVGASSAEWEAAIWDRKTGRLMHLFDMPLGLSADNVAIAFSQDGSQFACSSGSEARRWDITSGKSLNSWKFPQGLVDVMAYTPTGQLLLFRMENEDGRPLIGNSWQEHRRVCRVRDLLSENPVESLYEKRDFNRVVLRATIDQDGSYIVAHGLGGTEGKENVFRAFDGRTGIELWQRDHIKPDRFSVDPTGKLLAAIVDDIPRLWEMPAGNVLNPADAALPGIIGLGPRAEYYVGGSGSGLGAILWRRSDASRLATLAIDFEMSAMPAFDVQGVGFALGTMDGQVLIYDLNDVRHRLAQMGLDW